MSSQWDNLQRMLRAIQDYGRMDEHLRSVAQHLQFDDALARYPRLMDLVSPSLRLSYQQSALDDALSRIGRASALRNLLDEASAASILNQRLYEQQQMLEHLIGSRRTLIDDLPVGVTAAIEAARTWSDATDIALQRFHNLGLLGRRDEHIERVLSPASAFSSFVSMASEQLNTMADGWRISAGTAAFELIRNQYDEIARTWAILPAPSDDDDPSEQPTLLGPLTQFEDAIALPPEHGNEPDEAYLLQRVQSIRSVADAQVTVSGVFRSNEVSMSAKRIEMFKPTTRFAESCTDLAWIVAKDKKTLGNLIDALYIIFYEAPGKDKLRFLKDFGGTLEPAQCDFIWVVKHLRNKYSRHDPDHGKESEISKSWEQLQEKWRLLGLEQAPFAEGHFRAIQSGLLQMAREFVEMLLASMSGGPIQ